MGVDAKFDEVWFFGRARSLEPMGAGAGGSPPFGPGVEVYDPLPLLWGRATLASAIDQRQDGRGGCFSYGEREEEMRRVQPCFRQRRLRPAVR